MNQYLQTLELDDYAKPEDIKRKFRELSKRYHPDAGWTDGSQFIAVKAAYEWLIKNHKPKLDMRGMNRYYRVLSIGDKKRSHTIYIPEATISEDSVIWCMLGGTEFRIMVKAGTRLPITFEVDNMWMYHGAQRYRCSIFLTIKTGEDKGYGS